MCGLICYLSFWILSLGSRNGFDVDNIRYQGSLPDLFREGHSVVVEGFVKPFTDDVRKEVSSKSVSGKARSAECYFAATEVLAKHDEKYMPQEVATAIEKNKKMIEAGETTVAGAKAS